MWCQWVKSYLLKGRSLWEVNIPSDSSWVWRKLLGLRPNIRPLLKHSIGDGENTCLWYDNWHPLGPLIDYFGSRIIYDSALPRNAKVKSIVEGRVWKWPPIVTIQLLELQRHTPIGFLPNALSRTLLFGAVLEMVNFLLVPLGMSGECTILGFIGISCCGSLPISLELVWCYGLLLGID